MAFKQVRKVPAKVAPKAQGPGDKEREPIGDEEEEVAAVAVAPARAKKPAQRYIEAKEEEYDEGETEVDESGDEMRITIRRGKKRAAEKLELMDMRRQFKDRVLVSFQTTNEPEGVFPIKAGINGHTFVIKREEPVPLPRCVLRMLDNCIYTQYREDKERSKKGELVYKARPVRRFPYSVLADPSPADGNFERYAVQVSQV